MAASISRISCFGDLVRERRPRDGMCSEKRKKGRSLQLVVSPSHGKKGTPDHVVSAIQPLERLSRKSKRPGEIVAPAIAGKRNA
jgi:hypothetical protein